MKPAAEAGAEAEAKKAQRSAGRKAGSLARRVEGILDEAKALDITRIDVRDLTTITDYMIMVTGNSRIHTRALADTLVEKMKEQGRSVTGVEGLPAADWVLVDLGSVVVHIMLAQVRAHYSLEELWSLKPADSS